MTAVGREGGDWDGGEVCSNKNAQYIKTGVQFQRTVHEAGNGEDREPLQDTPMARGEQLR